MSQFDLNKAANLHEQKSVQKDTERFEDLAGEVALTVRRTLTALFPHLPDGTPDWDKFNWDEAESFKNMLKQYRQTAVEPTVVQTTNQPSGRQAAMRNRPPTTTSQQTNPPQTTQPTSQPTTQQQTSQTQAPQTQQTTPATPTSAASKGAQKLGKWLKGK